MSTVGSILKVRLGNDTRRQVLYNTNISYNDLVLMLQRIFGAKLKASDDITLKYLDEDDDLITIVDDADFAHAREYCKSPVVRMVIYVNGCDLRTTADGAGIISFRKELRQVCTKITTVLDSLDSHVVVAQEDTPTTSDTVQLTTTTIPTAAVEKEDPKPVMPTEAVSLFDPYKSSSISNTKSDVITATPTAGVISSTNPTNVIAVTPASVIDDSTSTTSHLFQGQSDVNFPISQPHSQPTNTQDPVIPPQPNPTAPPTAPPISSSPKPAPYIPPSQNNATQYANYPPGRPNYSGYNYGASYPNQPPASNSPGVATTTQYPHSQYPTSAGSTYPSSTGVQPYPPQAPSPGGGQPMPGTYGGNQPTYPVGGAAGRGRMTAYGQTPYKVGY